MEKKDSSVTKVQIHAARRFLHVAHEMRRCSCISTALEAGAKEKNKTKHKKKKLKKFLTD
jgi:hypothetical protein